MALHAVTRQWVDRDSMGHSIAWSVDGFPGLHVRQTAPGSAWQFDLHMNTQLRWGRGGITSGIDWGWVEQTEAMFQAETENPGLRDLEDFPEELRPSIRMFRVLHEQRFDRRRQALEELSLALAVLSL